MGIRYYAYAFDADMTERAKADPRSFISDDPLADAWGLPHGAQTAVTNFEQSVPSTEMLNLDKAWPLLQEITKPSATDRRPRPGYRMFEGQATMHGDGWTPWVRALSPTEVIEIAEDLVELLPAVRDAEIAHRDTRYVLDYLNRAVEFVTGVAASNRGFAYLIG
ncbi:hypothetical protein ACPPVQ_07715 [Diaminobutyricibacter sp. McL0618]|uniref:hypothetical protein n=1 Tax=Leifsonia sp. McL0618 TaxID=3415677 RepID=UPI003CF4A36D